MHLVTLIAVLGLTQSPTEQCSGPGVTYRDRAAALYGQGDLPAAIRELEGAIVRCPQEPFYDFMLANAWLRFGNFEAAAVEYRRYLGRRPDDFEAVVSLGFALRKLGDTRDAFVWATRAVHLRRSEPLAHALMAVASIDSGDPESGLYYYEQAADLDARYVCSSALIDIRWDSTAKATLEKIRYRSARYSTASCNEKDLNDWKPRGLSESSHP